MSSETVRYEYGGKFTSRGEWSHPERKNATHEWIVVTEGEAWIEVGETLYRLKAGSVLFLEAGRLHRGVGISKERVSFFWIHYHGDALLPGNPCFSLCDPYAVWLLCRQLLHYSRTEAAGAVSDALLLVLLTELDLQSRQTQIVSHALAARVREWIRINIDRSIDAREVAAQFGYHVDYLSRVLRGAYGNGLKAEIDSSRMREIKRLLLESDLTLTEIADRVGMQDYKLFLKFFKYHEGVTPTEFRKIYPYFHTNNR